VESDFGKLAPLDAHTPKPYERFRSIHLADDPSVLTNEYGLGYWWLFEVPVRRLLVCVAYS